MPGGITVTPGNPDTVAFSGTIPAALKVHGLVDGDPANTVYCTSNNYVYDTAIANGSVPYGTKGFVVIHKGGDGAVFKSGQATVAGWAGGAQAFETSVGFKTGGTLGAPAPGDPTVVLTFP